MFKKIIVLYFIFAFNSILFAQVQPLMVTQWGQNCYYNDYLPKMPNSIACDKAFVGCFAVAWAQIFAYYQFPKTPNALNYSELKNTSYIYSDMPQKVKTKNSEVAKLMYHIGLVSQTQWNNKNSITDFDAKPIVTHFNYRESIKTIDLKELTINQQIEIIKNELDNKRPVFVKNDFHYYVIDGYNSDNQFHFNFGWGGQFNGYYFITNCVTPAGNLNPTQIMINIEPNRVF